MTLLDAAKLGPSLSVFIQVTLEKQIEEMLESFEQSIKRFPEVMECYLMTGDSDYLLRVVVRDTVELQHFIIERLTKARGVANIRSSFALKQVKYKTALPENVLVGSQSARAWRLSFRAASPPNAAFMELSLVAGAASQP